MEDVHWSEEEVNKKLQKKMSKAAGEVWDASRKHKTTLRTAAFVVALERIVAAMK
jgi:glutamate dehydrogenase (NAD(P)+)